MRYLLSNLTITESSYEYVLDSIKVYFSLDVLEVPYINMGTHTRYSTLDPNILSDSIATDVSEFISKMSTQGINLSLKSISNSGNKYIISIDYLGTEINFELNEII